MTNPIIAELKAIEARLRAMFPESPHIALSATRAGLEVALHGAGDYAAVTALLRRIGIGERSKSVFDASSERPWSVQRGDVDGVHFVGFCSNLPPSCHIEQIEETVPEYAETGRTITQTRRVVKCGGAAA